MPYLFLIAGILRYNPPTIAYVCITKRLHSLVHLLIAPVLKWEHLSMLTISIINYQVLLFFLLVLLMTILC